MRTKIIELRESGYSYREIARTLGIGKTTVEHHCNPIRGRDEQRKWRNKRRKVLVEENGGRCYICGYNKCLTALDFHHRDPSQKEFGIARMLNNGAPMERLKREIQKCVLICSNCHHEVHEGITAL